MTSSTRQARRRLVRLASLSALAAALFPREAQAQDFIGGGGVYVSFTFGSDYFATGWGVEGVFTTLLQGGTDCSNGSGRAGLGLNAQLGAINVDTFRFVAAAHGGGNVGDDLELPVLDGEFGLALHADDDGPQVGIHTGIVFDVPFSPVTALSNFFRAEWLLNEYSVGGGVISPGRFGLSQTTCIDGRPLRDDMRVLPLARPLGVDASRLDAAAQAWVDDAQAEAASVPAFLCLAAELLQANAPLELVDRALDAATDEIRHARACAEVASRLAGVHIVPTVPAPPRRSRLQGDALFTRLAVESWLDGCLNEGAAAARAERAGRLAQRGSIRAARQQIAVDESRHAELGWQVLAFAIGRGGSQVRDAVRDLRSAAAAFTREGAAGDGRWGQLGRADAEAANAHATLDAHQRLDTLL